MNSQTATNTNNNSQVEKTTSTDRPQQVGDWTLAEIRQALSRKLPDELVKTLPGKGNAQFISWHSVIRILDKYCPGWSWEIKQMSHSEDRLFLVGRLTITAKDGIFFHEATGTEVLKKDDKEISYGDPSSNAESMALRRAAAKFNLGLYLYSK